MRGEDMQYYWISVLIGSIFAAVLGLIPASIAKRKGRSFGLWWFYGFLFFLLSMIHVMLIADYSTHGKNNTDTADPGQGRMPAAAAGIFFVILALYHSYWIFWVYYYASFILPADVGYVAVLFVLSIFLFVGRKNLITLLVFIFYGLYVLLTGRFTGLLELLGILLLAGLLTVNILPSLRAKAPGLTKKLWFFPGVLHLSGYVLRLVVPAVDGYSLTFNWQVGLIQMAQAAGYLMMGLWLLEAHGARAAEPSSVVIYTDSSEESVSDLPNEDRSIEDALKSYRSLVDSGLMTEAEFREKKRQLLDG